MEYKERYDFAEVVEIIARLRGEGGCPWDRAQTHESLRSCLMEESGELLAAIRLYAQEVEAQQEAGPGLENLVEELGDVLLQVLLHAQIGRESGAFTMEDVISGLGRKMIRRHPHVFGQVDARTPEQALSSWETAKSLEVKAVPVQGAFGNIPMELPELSRAVKTRKILEKTFGQAPDEEAALAALEGFGGRWRDAGGKEERRAVLADALWELAGLAHSQKIYAELALADKLAEIHSAYDKSLDKA